MIRQRVLLVDVAIAAVLAILVLVLSPGLAIAGIVGMVVVLVCVISFVFDARRAGSRRVRPPRRPSRGR